MAYLLDTSLLVRLANATDAKPPLAARAVVELHRRGELLHLTPQILVEFRNVATRPVVVNGMGLTDADAESHAATFEARFPLLTETPAVFPIWKALVGALGVIGKQVHDARLVSVCHVHGVTHLLTFNTAHIIRMGGFPPGVVAVDPASV